MQSIPECGQTPGREEDNAKRLSQAGEPLLIPSLPTFRREYSRPLGLLTPLPPSLPPNSRFLLPLPLGAGLLVEPPFPKLGIEPGSLDLSLEPAKCPVETFVILDEDFQTDHAPFSGFEISTSS